MDTGYIQYCYTMAGLVNLKGLAISSILVVSLASFSFDSNSNPPIYAQTVSTFQTHTTSGGTLDVAFSTNSTSPKAGDHIVFIVKFLKKATQGIQQHIDYRLIVLQGNNQVFGTSISHTAEGAVSVPIQFQNPGKVQVIIEVDGILFQPITPESATFDLNIGGTPQTKAATSNSTTQNTITQQQYKPGFGQGPPPNLIAPTSHKPYIANDGMLVEANRIYSLKFPNWNYTIDSRGPEYGMTITYDVNRPFLAGMKFQTFPNVISSNNEISYALFANGLGSLQSLYNYYDNNGGTGKITVGSMILASDFIDLAKEYGMSLNNSDITDVKFQAIRFDKVNYVPSFQIDSSYKYNQTQYHELDTYYIMGSMQMRLTCAAQMDQYDRFYPSYIQSVNSLVTDPTMRADTESASRLLSDFDSFKTNHLLDNMTKPWPDLKIEYNFPTNLNKTEVTIPIQTAKNSTYDHKIPSWIKNNAKWWNQGSIGDDEFVKGIEYLIKENIIQVNQTSAASSSLTHIPNWIKNLAGMWTDNQVSDDDFKRGMQYLVQTGIINLN